MTYFLFSLVSDWRGFGPISYWFLRMLLVLCAAFDLTVITFVTLFFRVFSS